MRFTPSELSHGEHTYLVSNSKIKTLPGGTSLVVHGWDPALALQGVLVLQWLRIRFPMQGTRVWSLVPADPTCCGEKPWYATRERPPQKGRPSTAKIKIHSKLKTSNTADYLPCFELCMQLILHCISSVSGLFCSALWDSYTLWDSFTLWVAAGYSFLVICRIPLCYFIHTHEGS